MGNRIKKLREEVGWRQEDLAKKLDVGKSTVGEWETGKKTPRPDKLIKLAEIFNTSIDYLLGKTDNKDPIDEIKADIESSTPDLLEIIKRTRPHIGGVPISEDQAEIIIDILKAYKKQKLKELGKERSDDINFKSQA